MSTPHSVHCHCVRVLQGARRAGVFRAAANTLSAQGELNELSPRPSCCRFQGGTNIHHPSRPSSILDPFPLSRVAAPGRLAGGGMRTFTPEVSGPTIALSLPARVCAFAP